MTEAWNTASQLPTELGSKGPAQQLRSRTCTAVQVALSASVRPNTFSSRVDSTSQQLSTVSPA